MKRLKIAQKFALSLVTGLVSVGYALPSLAILGSPVGVIRSAENEHQWTAITSRLQRSGIDYCVLDARNWQEVTDFGSIQVLILPNVASINGGQAEALQQWMNTGGRVIVTGPTGSLAQPDVRDQLRSLFGAYWGFSNVIPSTLRLSSLPTAYATQANLSSTLVGGVLIPTAVNSETAAVWLADGTPPAVITTDQSIFIGWRWGVDEVAETALDVAWLQASLNRFGVRPTQTISTGSPPECKPSVPIRQETAPIPLLPNLDPAPESPVVPQPTSVPDVSPTYENIPPSPPATSNQPLNGDENQVLVANREEAIPLSLNQQNAAALSPNQVNEMSTELTDLIARFESTLIAAEANHQDQESPDKASDAPPSLATRRSYETLQSARENLVQFKQLVAQQNYTKARQKWLKARRMLWDNYPTDRLFAQPEVRAMWLDRGTIVKAKSEADLAVIFDRMAEAGINTVFFETVNASYPIYPSRVAPEQNPLTKGWDPLKAAVKLAHERNMELHAWVWAFAAANQGHNKVLDQPEDYLGPVLSRNPDWGITDRKGNPFDTGAQFKKSFYDPANPEVRRYLLALYEEIVTNYDVDGLQLDYIRYPFQDPKYDSTYGFSKVSRALFKDIYQVDPIEITPSHPLWNAWVGFRVRQVDSFVATVSAQLKQKNPDLILSTAVFPLKRQDRLFRLQQNWEAWMEQEWVDMIVLMTYALDTGSLEDRTAPLFDPSAIKSSLVIPGLRLLKVPDSVTIDQLQLVRNMPTGGYALFAAENLTPNLQTILGRIQGESTNQQEPLPYRQPFQASTQRYQALQQEWDFLLSQQQLQMSSSARQAWEQQSKALGQSLEQLAQNPSPQTWKEAQSRLSQFRQQFSGWMGEQRQVYPYQVQVWENRLATLEKLLVYGERRVIRAAISYQ
ncbi:MAG: family 10 glycosylhydrolase [Microcystaceae cyanobacterium]